MYNFFDISNLYFEREDISFIIEMMMMKNIESANYDYAIKSNA